MGEWWKIELSVCHDVAVIEIKGRIALRDELGRFIEKLKALSEYLPASAIEARRAETGTGSVEDESAGPKDIAQNTAGEP